MKYRAGPLLVLVLGCMAAATVRPLDAQQTHTAADPLAAVRQSLPAAPDSARGALSALLWETIAKAEASEFALAQALNVEEVDSTSAAASEVLYDSVADGRVLLVALLDTVVLKTEWGAGELTRLRRRYPSSALFLRYEARLASQRGEHEIALAIYTRMLGQRPSDAELHISQAKELEALGRTTEAAAAYTRAFELEPSDEALFRALVRLREQSETLPALLEQVRRLRTLYPDTPGLAERETEILHRLGRLTEVGATAYQPREEIS
jgi:tetratricopeptide (TPR) repeat protein